MTVEYSVDRKQIKNLEKAQEMLARMHVEIGLPESASARNRFMLALHERMSGPLSMPVYRRKCGAWRGKIRGKMRMPL